MTLKGLVPRLGRYVVVIHFYQPAHPTFPAQVSVDGGRLRPGELQRVGPAVTCLTRTGRGVTGTSCSLPPGVFRASFCPHVLGCQNQVIAEDQIEFAISEPEVAVTVKVPEEKSLVLVRSACPSACSSQGCLGCHSVCLACDNNSSKEL